MAQVELIGRPGLKKGDIVQVIAGREKGKVGKVMEIRPERQQVLVEKINILKKHQKPSQKQRQGGIIEMEGPLHVSNVMPVCPACNKPTRIGKKTLADGTKLRTCKRCGEALDKG
jgi:large subunit ribosomal protein L24